MSDIIYENLTDADLLLFLRSGDLSAERTLFDRYKPVVLCHARTFFLRGGDREDLTQEGMIGLLRAVSDYNPQKGASFHTFAELCIKNQIKTAVTLYNRKKHAPLNSALSLDMPPQADASDGFALRDLLCTLQTPDPEDQYIDNERFERLIPLLEKQLSKMERRALALYLQGLSYIEIAKIMEKPIKAVDNALVRARRKTEQILRFD